MTRETGTTFKALCKALNISMALASHWASFAEHCLLWWERWKKTQGVLEKGQRRPRWRGKFDSLRAEAVALEDARALRAVKPSEWKQLANQFRKVNRITAAKYYQGMVIDGR